MGSANVLQDCISKLRTTSGKESKFAKLEKKINGRFSLGFVIDVGEIGKMKAGFDNHKNHQRPHIHVETNNGRISVAIDDGKILHDKNKKIKDRDLSQITDWIKGRKECLKFIYENIQNCKRSDDFQPLIDAMNKYQ